MAALGRFFRSVVDEVNRLEAEARAGRQGRLADQLARSVVAKLDELGYQPFTADRRPAADSTWSAGSTSGPRSSSPPT